MAQPRITWQKKVLERIGHPRRGAIPNLARRLHRSSRTVRNWLEDARSPHNEADIISEIAIALRVPESWLRNGLPGDPPHIPETASADWIRFVDRSALPSRIKPLAYALADRHAAEWLADAYEKLYLPTRKPSTRPASR